VVPRSSDRISRVPPYLIRPVVLPVRGCHPLWPVFPDSSSHTQGSAGPRSLATTNGVSVDFLSSGYLDVSVPRVRFFNPMYSGQRYLCYLIIDTREGNNNQISGGLPHSEILGSKPIPGSPKLIAGYHVLHRLLLPRHPPNALIALDPTRKEQGSSGSEVYFSRSSHAGSHARNLVSVLDLDSIALRSRTHPEGPARQPDHPHSGKPAQR